MAKNIGGTLYSGAAAYGRFTSMLGAIIMTIIGIGLIIGGIYLMVNKDKHSLTAKAVITEAQCSQTQTTINNKPSISYSCMLTIQYSVSNVLYTNKVQANGQHTYNKGEFITVQYTPSDPNDVELKPSISRTTIGAIMIGIALIMMLMSWGSAYLARKYKFAAAFQGIGSGVSTISNILR